MTCTSLFPVVEDPTIAAHNMNHDLTLIGKWGQNWRMSFNPDPQMHLELTFSRKRTENDHPHSFCNGIPAKYVNDHKHLEIILDSKLSFTPHSKLGRVHNVWQRGAGEIEGDREKYKEKGGTFIFCNLMGGYQIFCKRK